MTKTMSIAGTTLELVERGDGRPLYVLARWRGARAGASVAPTAVPEVSGYRAVASGLWQLNTFLVRADPVALQPGMTVWLEPIPQAGPQ